MSKGSDWYAGKKPDPPFPEQPNKRKAKRNRIKLSLRVPEGTPIDDEACNAIRKLTSSEKGLGRQECIRVGEHDFVGREVEWYLCKDGRWPKLYFCRRCGELGHSELF